MKAFSVHLINNQNSKCQQWNFEQERQNLIKGASTFLPIITDRNLFNNAVQSIKSLNLIKHHISCINQKMYDEAIKVTVDRVLCNLLYINGNKIDTIEENIIIILGHMIEDQHSIPYNFLAEMSYNEEDIYRLHQLRTRGLELVEHKIIEAEKSKNLCKEDLAIRGIFKIIQHLRQLLKVSPIAKHSFYNDKILYYNSIAWKIYIIKDTK